MEPTLEPTPMSQPDGAGRPRPSHPLAARYRQIRAESGALTDHLPEAVANGQSMTDASPAKWHLAHTTWFFETFVLEAFEPGFRPFDPAFRVLFNSYYNGVGDKHPRAERGLIQRPDLAGVREYRQQVDRRLVELIERQIAPQTGDPARRQRLAGLIELGLNHEQQHQELILTDVKHLLSRDPSLPAYQSGRPLAPVATRRPGWIGMPAGLYEIGHDGHGFAFDNEGPRHRVWLDDFELAACPVTHGEFRAFIDDGGYRRPELWLSLGWDMVRQAGWQHPLYWQRADRGWTTFTLHGPMPIDDHAPVCHLSYFEADAYARWAGARLPTEAEWEVVAQRFDDLPAANLADSRRLHPAPPRTARIDERPQQLFGDVWEWTSSSYSAYPRFAPAAGAVGEYNGKFMCNQYVLRGGSCATPAGHLRATYRNFFPPEARWQFSGLRLARDR